MAKGAIVAMSTIVGAGLTLLPIGAAGAAQSLPSPSTPLSYAKAGAVVTQILGPLKPVSGSTTRGINGHTITITGISMETSGGQPALQGQCAGAEARFNRANRQGGVRGYKINYIGCTDDGGSPQVADQLIHKAVQQQNAFAIVPLSSEVTSAADGTFLNQNHELYFGAGISPTYCGWNTAPFAFSSMQQIGCSVTSSKEFLSSYSLSVYDAYAYKQGKKPADVKWALASTNIPQDHAISNAQASIAKSLGNEVVYNEWPGAAPGSPPVTNWAPTANAIIQSGANVVENELVGLPGLNLNQALKAAGFKGEVMGVGFNNPALLSIPSLAANVNGALAEDAWVGSSAYPSKQLTTVAADLHEINSKFTVNDFQVLWGYQAADFFLQALSKTKGALTEEKVANLINGGFTYTGFGTATGPSVWPQGHETQSNFAGIERVNATEKKGVALVPIGQYGANYLVPNS